MAIANETALVRMSNKASTDLTGKEGYIAVYDSGLKPAATASLASALGAIVEGGVNSSDIAIAGAFPGVVRLKAGGAITVGAKLKVVDGGTVQAYSSGAGTVVGVALQAAAQDDLFEAVLLTPTTCAS